MNLRQRLASSVLVATAGLLAACTTPPAPTDGTLSPAQVAALLASPERSAADRLTDARRKPQALLEFIGVRPGIVALDLSAGGGYTSELIARAAGPQGRVYGQGAPRDPARASAPPQRPRAARCRPRPRHPVRCRVRRRAAGRARSPSGLRVCRVAA